jgi:hypothetical protein
VNEESLKRFHLIFGLLLFALFVLTGQYMDRVLHHLQGMPDGPRMLYRSRHIYILLTGLLHLGIGSYMQYQTDTIRRTLQWAGSLLITIAAVLFLVAFFYEPNLSGLYAPVTKKGIYLVATGVLLHLLSTVRSRQQSVGNRL